MTHTPGPWTIGKYGRVQTQPNAQGGCIVIVDESLSQANARLIAAAPDLLAALRDAVKSLEWAQKIIRDIPANSSFAEGLNEARAAIAKATQS